MTSERTNWHRISFPWKSLEPFKYALKCGRCKWSEEGSRLTPLEDAYVEHLMTKHRRFS